MIRIDPSLQRANEGVEIIAVDRVTGAGQDLAALVRTATVEDLAEVRNGAEIKTLGGAIRATLKEHQIRALPGFYRMIH